MTTEKSHEIPSYTQETLYDWNMEKTKYVFSFIVLGLIGGVLLGFMYSLFLGLIAGLQIGVLHGLIGSLIYAVFYLLISRKKE